MIKDGRAYTMSSVIGRRENRSSTKRGNRLISSFFMWIENKRKIFIHLG